MTDLERLKRWVEKERGYYYLLRKAARQQDRLGDAARQNDRVRILQTVYEQIEKIQKEGLGSHTDWKAIAQAEVESFGRRVTAEEVRQLNEPFKEHIIAALDKTRNGKV